MGHQREIGFPGLVCRHCMSRPTGRKFFTTSSDHLGLLLLSIADHVAICKECPATIKSLVTSYKNTHESQQQQLAEGIHGLLMQRIWQSLLRDPRDVNTITRVR